MKKMITAMALIALTGCLDNQASYENCNSVSGACGQETNNEKTDGINDKQEIVKTDTLYQTIRDTVVIKQQNTDTVTVKEVEVVTDTIKEVVTDTLVIRDTLLLKADTVITVDTLVTTDTIVKVDTLLTSDTLVVYDTIPQTSLDIRDTVIEYCETSNKVKTCIEYTGKILGEYFYDLESRPYSSVNNPVCTGEDWHLFNFEDAYLWKDNLGEIISGVDHIVLSKEKDGSYNVTTRFSQNKHYPGTDNLKYKCVLKLK